MKTKTSKNKPLPAPLLAIQESCLVYRGELASCSNLFQKMNAAILKVRSEHMPMVSLRAGCAQGAQLRLRDLVDANRAVFDKPKTRIFSDIKVGLHKQKGETVIEDEDKTLELIEKHFPARLDELAPLPDPAKRRISKKALSNLTGAELKKIGVEITADTDEVLVAPQDSDVEKAVAALLKESATEPLAKAA